MTHQCYVLAGKKPAGLSRCVRARIEPMFRLLLFVVGISSKTMQRNCGGVPFRIDCPTMLKWNSRHMTSFAEEIGDHLLPNEKKRMNHFYTLLIEGTLVFSIRVVRIKLLI